MARRSRIEIGDRFGRLTVEAFVGMRNSSRVWWCRCDCGETREVRANHLKAGGTVACRRCTGRSAADRDPDLVPQPPDEVERIAEAMVGAWAEMGEPVTRDVVRGFVSLARHWPTVEADESWRRTLDRLEARRWRREVETGQSVPLAA